MSASNLDVLSDEDALHLTDIYLQGAAWNTEKNCLTPSRLTEHSGFIGLVVKKEGFGVIASEDKSYVHALHIPVRPSVNFPASTFAQWPL